MDSKNSAASRSVASAADESSTCEADLLDFIYGMVRLLKPKRAIETGSQLVRYAVAIGSAMRDNGFGKLVKVEVDPEVCRRALIDIQTSQLCDWVQVVVQQDLAFESSNGLDFAFVGLDGGSGGEEFLHFFEELTPDTTVVFHDSAPQDNGSGEAIRELIGKGRLAGSFFSTPRGLFVGRVQRPPDLPALSFTRSLRNLEHATTNSCGLERKAILVLGMHRSGTSALARVLNLLGAALPRRLLGAARGNPLGHWESEPLMEMDDEILRSMGRSWDDPRQISPSWFRSSNAYVFHQRLREIILSEYGDAPLIVIKEPRICRLAPLYLDVLDTMGIKSCVILPVRHPAEVIRSINERDELDPATIELLWLRHILEAETASRMCRRVWTSYEQLVQNWETTVQSIARVLDLTWPVQPGEARPAIQEFLRPRHHHHKADSDPDPPRLGGLTNRAWNAIQRAMDGEEAAAQAIFDEINATITEIDRMNLPREEAFQKQLFAFETERNYFRDHLVNSEANLSAVSARLAESDAKLARANEELARMKEELAQADRNLAQANERFLQGDRNLAEVNERLAEFHTSEITYRDEIARLSAIAEMKLKLEADLRLANDQISSLGNAVENLNSRISSMLASRSWQITAPFRVVQRWVLGR